MEAMEMATQAKAGLARVEERMEVLAERMGHAMHRLGSSEQASEAIRTQLGELREDVRRQVVSLRGDLEAQIQSWMTRISAPEVDQHYQADDASSGGSSPMSGEQTAHWPTSLIEDGNECLTRSEDSASSPQAWMVNGDKSRELEPLDLSGNDDAWIGSSPIGRHVSPSAVKFVARRDNPARHVETHQGPKSPCVKSPTAAI
jgi:hypothetical protein